MTVDSNARRQAILFEVAAVSARIAADESITDPAHQLVALADSWDAVVFFSDTGEAERTLVELAGRCVAWLEHLESEKAKAS
jgi:hypothetical protein